ncbi:hypothetical protein Maq22A_c24280 [Methylobacterium aquaticum]|uniref:Uncharacterized protein n=1 Tax=Methylobacterium aquaticum TaxID=270351 RepID=A0A0C6FX20_9HYPH|nr:hypothetical protein Maq22A_c24280 [Methylobacterium aquaticum]
MRASPHRMSAPMSHCQVATASGAAQAAASAPGGGPSRPVPRSRTQTSAAAEIVDCRCPQRVMQSLRAELWFCQSGVKVCPCGKTIYLEKL